MKVTQNIDQLRLATTYLGDLVNEFVFVGGTIPSLLITDPAAPDVRQTDDVDVITKTVTRSEYYKIEEKLRELKFLPDLSEQNPIICRWIKDGLKLDVMPTSADIFGFSNNWYEEAFVTPIQYFIDDDISIKIINAPLFICTKIEALKSRGESKDGEDIIRVIDGRESLFAEISTSPDSIRNFVKAWATESLQNKIFLETIIWCLPGDAASQARETLILDRLRNLSRNL